jgi:hypothetical protein
MNYRKSDDQLKLSELKTKSQYTKTSRNIMSLQVVKAYEGLFIIVNQLIIIRGFESDVAN